MAAVLVVGACAAPGPTPPVGATAAPVGPPQRTPAPASSAAPSGSGASSGSAVPASSAALLVTGAGSPVPAGLVDPCALGTLAELSALTGATLVKGERDQDEDGTYVGCHYFVAAQQPDPEIGIDLYPFEASLLTEYRDNVATGDYEALPGVGDVAFVFKPDGPEFSSDAAGRKGSIWWSVFTPSGSPGRPTGKQQAIALATLVAQRLP